MPYKLLSAFQGLFEGHRYLHRNSTLGDFVAVHLFEDLYERGMPPVLRERIALGSHTVNLKNVAVGKKARRGDGTFGERAPSVPSEKTPDFDVQRGPVATIEIGVETKILAKAMIKQIDRVVNDLMSQVTHFEKGGSNPITVAIVGVNSAEKCRSFEGKRTHPTNGRSAKHPFQEAPRAIEILREKAEPSFDEFMVLEFRATNFPPYDFAWVNLDKTELEYSSLLVRVSNLYKTRFG